ncbi:MAG: hypothetical protein O2971_12395 [Proteobacteria bacterium]|nr:hypothetical protein [Pseudomonadota bacterium]
MREIAFNSKPTNTLLQELLLSLFLLFVSYQAVATTTVNTQLAVSTVETHPLGYAFFVVNESQQNGTDLNGDGDTDGYETVLHIYDAVENEIINLGYAVVDGNTRFSGQWLVFQVWESRQGFTDLNNDGDTNDAVLFYYDLFTGDITNTELAGSPIGVSPNNQIYFVMRENSGYPEDLNGDGDTADNIAHVYDIPTDTVLNLGISANGYAPYGEGFAVLSREVDQGHTDLNGDSDILDYILHVYDSTDGSLTNTMRAAFPDSRVKGFLLAVSEQMDGVDWNSDGDLADIVLQIYDMDTRSFINLGKSYTLHLVEVSVNGDYMAWVARESSEGNSDLNGDGDTGDEVMFVYDRSTDTVTNLGIAGERGGIHTSNGFVAFLANESGQREDLNFDGDTSDRVAHIYDFATGTVTNMEIGVFQTGQIRAHGDYAVFHWSEWRNGNIDINGDGDSSDYIMHVYNHNTGEVDNLGEDGFFYDVYGNNLLMVFYEFRTGKDYNEDGDTDDWVLHIIDGESLLATSLDVSGSPLQLGPLLLVQVYESSANEDLNGDGDLSDLVLFILDPNAEPEPISTIAELIALVQSEDLDNGLENALLAKLQAAQAALDRGNSNTAVNNLQAFINQVEAQRDKKLSSSQADALIEIALNIIAAIVAG